MNGVDSLRVSNELKAVKTDLVRASDQRIREPLSGSDALGTFKL